MSYFSQLLNLDESSRFNFDEDFPEDISGFSEEVTFGDIKMDKPSTEGLDAAVSAMDQFVDATDDRNYTDISLSFHDSFPEDKSGFSEASEGLEPEKEEIDPNTIPAANAENDQFEEVDFDATIPVKMSPAELASDKDEKLIESFFDANWDDLY